MMYGHHGGECGLESGSNNAQRERSGCLVNIVYALMYLPMSL